MKSMNCQYKLGCFGYNYQKTIIKPLNNNEIYSAARGNLGIPQQLSLPGTLTKE